MCENDKQRLPKVNHFFAWKCMAVLSVDPPLKNLFGYVGNSNHNEISVFQRISRKCLDFPPRNMASRTHKGPCFSFTQSLGPVVGALSNENTNGFLCQVLARSAGIMTGSIGHFQMLTLLGIDGCSFIAGDSKETIVEELLRSGINDSWNQPAQSTIIYR